MSFFTESDIELIALEHLQALGYEFVTGPEISTGGLYAEREHAEVVLKNRLKNAIDRLNPHQSEDVKKDALKKMLRPSSPNLLITNEEFHNFITQGVEIEKQVQGETKGDIIKVIDWEQPDNNEFLAVNQFTIIEGNYNKRPDIILFVNGLPLIVIELKNPHDQDATVKQAFKQLQTYIGTIPSLFQYNALCIASDGWEAKAGTITSDWSRFMAWKSIDGVIQEADRVPQLEVMIKGMLNKHTLLDLVKQFIVFEKDKEKTIKKVSAYHQYYAVNKAVEQTKRATGDNGDQRVGVVWHTQGSGKSLTMVFYTGKLVLSLNNPTIVVLTDRNDLDDQLFDTFSNCQQLLRQTPVQAESRDDLRKKLTVASGGIVFTTIQKFMPDVKGGDYKALSERKNIVVIADEAHRSQYDFLDGLAKNLRDALPNASFIGFTGTPIETADKNTQAVFGDYIDVYDIQQAVEDGATVRIYYENRLAKVNLKEEEKEIIDAEFEELTESEELTEKQKLKSKWARVEALVGSEDRQRRIAEDLVNHFEQRIGVMEGKGMIVCMSRRICIDLHNQIIKLRPEWYDEEDDKGVIKVIMTGSSTDPVGWQGHIRNKIRRKKIGSRLKDPKDPLKLVIVRDMWLTGFDAPALHTLYVDKPMQSHNLMQAIARVNRVFKDKAGGLVVDYIGIGTDLKKALNTYTGSGGKGKPTLDQEEAVALMLTKYEIVCDMFQGFDYKRYFTLDTKGKFQFPIDAADYILGLEKGKERYLGNVTALLKAFALSVPHEKALEIRDEVALFQAIKARIIKLGKTTGGEGKMDDEELESAIRNIVSRAISTDEVIDVFAAAGLQKPEISILSEEFLLEVQGMKRRNLAVELLKKLLKDEIQIRMKSNIVQSKKFSEMLSNAVKKYQNNILTTAQILQELVDMAKDFRDSQKRNQDLGLTEDEIAFYDALEVNDSAVKILGDDILRSIARELVDSVKKNISIDWTIKESVRANLRRIVKRILNKYGYPPDKQAMAIDLVLKQAETLADDWV
jgi:type I restriction enzyme, R subunit